MHRGSCKSYIDLQPNFQKILSVPLFSLLDFSPTVEICRPSRPKVETMDEKIKQLLGLNLPNNVVATAVGVEESYITALLSQDSFAKEVAELRVATLSKTAERDQAYNAIEDSLLEKLKDQVESGLFGAANPSIILKALQIVNAAKRRSAPAELQGAISRPVVALVMPVAIAAKFVLDSKAQVVEVEGQTMAPMPAAGVQKALENLRSNEAANTKEHEDDVERARAAVSALGAISRLGKMEVQKLPIHEQL